MSSASVVVVHGKGNKPQLFLEIDIQIGTIKSFLQRNLWLLFQYLLCPLPPKIMITNIKFIKLHFSSIALYMRVTILVCGWCHAISSRSKFQIRVITLSSRDIPYFLPVVYYVCLWSTNCDLSKYIKLDYEMNEMDWLFVSAENFQPVSTMASIYLGMCHC